MRLLILALYGAVLLAASHAAVATTVTVETPLGSFNVRLYDDIAPDTVANFLNYVNDGDYDGTFIHRSIPGFVIQGGGFFFDGEEAQAIETDPPIANEFSESNVRGTIAMAKRADDPDSATSQWFINLVNNPDLDTQNGGFTVFGEVIGDGMQVVDAIAALQRFNFGPPFDSLPLIDFDGQTVVAENFVTTQISVRPEGQFAANEGLSGAWFDPDTPGQGYLLDVYPGSDGLEIFVAWFTYDTDEPDDSETLTFGTEQHRWFTAGGTIAGSEANLTINLNTGGVFNDPRMTSLAPVGTMSIQFQSCTSASLTFEFDSGESDTIEIIRLTPDTFCGALAETSPE